MTNEQRDAMAWLEIAITIAEAQKFGTPDSNKHRATIKSMLAGPRLPEEWPTGAIEAMRNAIAESQRGPYLTAEAAYRALCAHLSAPRTKEVWRVQPEGWPFEDFTAINVATARAGHWLAQDIEISIRKTTVST